MIDIKNLTIKKAHDMLLAGETTSVELVSACLKNIEERNKELNIFLEVFNDALAQAKEADEKIKNGNATMLTGIPIAIKDNMLITGKKVSDASKMLENYTASYDAFVVKNLKNEGAVLIGRTNMDEFAMGSSTENSAFGPVRNPFDPSRVPGGSSGGSAAAVAANMALGALGSDTGSSIRQPASLCGVVGMKPTYSAVSRSGIMAMASSLDQVGPIAKTSEDAKIIFDCISGHDEMDATSVNFLDFEVTPNKKILGIPRDFMKEGVDPEVLKNFEESLEKLKKLGYSVKDISMPHLEYSLPVYYILMPAEVSTNLARLDGVRYGLRKNGESVFDLFKKSRSAGFGAETRRRMILGTYVLSHGYYDAYYNKAWKLRHVIENEFKNIFEEVDFVVTPTAPTTAFKFGDKKDPLAMYMCDIFTTPANIAGLPAISVPSGFSSNGLPFGIQFNGPLFSDDAVFAIGKELEDNI
ncbi:MAG: Asp-tRNA(Asn)/Glu-tRNA(Gln) amidotransferase subunit GatA [Candidatus Nomurabacteria bacterium]|nr:Asp-tRNA(Asn)/Glu-tRNA(Gln) amidotransferase subunit GatA [Candidatus Nomurabacteria bacterium]